MDRALLILAAFAVIGCENAQRPVQGAAHDSVPGQVAQQDDAHGKLACASCHRGPRAELGRASVPREACTASGCHGDAGPAEVTLATARFEHRDHSAGGDVALSCAGCHTHNSGDEPIEASVDACALCHARELDGTQRGGEECRLCHRELAHTSLTSQGIPVAHGSLPWLETGCARCHYDVLATEKKVALETCTNCHKQAEDVTQRGIARDLHPTHTGVNCTSCHESGLHRIAAMSSAVRLQCADCHSSAHEQPVVTAAAPMCSSCHGDAHSAQQRMVLGFVGDESVLPSSKFMMGMTCRSCHMPPGAPATAPEARRGQADACVGCHEPEYRRVLQWWIDGTEERERAVRSYLNAAQRDLSNAPDTARMLVADAQAMLALVREAGGQHNVELADRIFRTSVIEAGNAYRLAGRRSPVQPELGNTAHVGTCSFCHYAGIERQSHSAASADLHERLIKIRR
ncbi:MAG TPA: cytochrome c3 family protein [Longimicrobiales bacterium]|nr:cytochrome c3 family protein [Longimicrobiales bacterium]